MSTLGIIAEYNPFHNGHRYHLLNSKKQTGCKYSIAVMSGQFLQRGEPAIFDKWIRTKMALSAGIDLIIELPFVFSTQDANGFAYAGIRLLESLGIIDYVSFGCENNQIELLSKIAEVLTREPQPFRQLIKKELKKGSNYPRIREKAIMEYFDKYHKLSENISIEQIKLALNQPNNVLAIEYLISLKKLNSFIKPIPIKRVGSNFNEYQLEGNFSSATAIRKYLFENKLFNCDEAIRKLQFTIPGPCVEIILNECQNGINPIFWSDFQEILLYKLRKMSKNSIKNIHGILEGLENKIQKNAHTYSSIENLIKFTKSKRYTRTRIQRLLVHILFDLTKSEIIDFNKKGPLYCRVLGMTKKGRLLLKEIKTHSKIPIITRFNDFYRQNVKHGNDLSLSKMINYDILATNLYVLAYKKEQLRTGGQDYSKRFIII